MTKVAGWFAVIILLGFSSFVVARYADPFFPGQGMLAQVGVSLGILPNQYNTLNDALNQKAAYLDERQAYLDAQQAQLASTSAAAASPASNPYLLYLIIAVVVLAALVGTNFYLDWRRTRAEKKTE